MATKRQYSAFQRACRVAFCSSLLVREAVPDGTVALVVTDGMGLAEICSVSPLPLPYPLSGSKSSGGSRPGLTGGESLKEHASPGEYETSFCQSGVGGASHCFCSGTDDSLGVTVAALGWIGGEAGPTSKGLDVLTWLS